MELLLGAGQLTLEEGKLLLCLTLPGLSVVQFLLDVCVVVLEGLCLEG